MDSTVPQLPEDPQSDRSTYANCMDKVRQRIAAIKWLIATAKHFQSQHFILAEAIFVQFRKIAKAIGTRLSKPMNEAAVNKTKDTPELKDVFDYQQRVKLLEGAFQVDTHAVRGKRILLVDDLYRSGATATIVAQALLAAGAAAVYMLAMTKTRTRT